MFIFFFTPSVVVMLVTQGKGLAAAFSALLAAGMIITALAQTLPERKKVQQ